MLTLDLNRLARVGTMPVQGLISTDPAFWEGTAITFAGDLTLAAEAKWLTGEEVLLVGRVSGTQSGECRRCVEGVERPVDVPLSLYYVPADRAELDAAEVRTYDPATVDLKLGDDVREEIILALDSYMECRPDCKGLCPQCGADLNEIECACVPETGDARWDALRALKAEQS